MEVDTKNYNIKQIQRAVSILEGDYKELNENQKEIEKNVDHLMRTDDRINSFIDENKNAARNILIAVISGLIAIFGTVIGFFMWIINLLADKL